MQKHLHHERDRLLRGLRWRVFDRFRLNGADALVAHLSESDPAPTSVQAQINMHLPCRLYPVEGGCLVKWRDNGEGLPSADFWIEPGGWDHEHCDACDRNIEVNGTAWLTVRGSFFQLCPYCYRRVQHLRHRPGSHGGL
jgi:hypothetical protein